MKVNDDLGNIILQAYYLVSDTDGPVKLYDMPIRLIQSGISLYSLNFFAPGYICPASYKIESKYMDTEAYKTRVSQCPALKYDEIEGYIENQGLKYTLVGNDKASTKYISGDAFSDGGKNYYIETECYINIDMETATADGFGYILTFNKEDSIRYNYTRLEDFEESDLEIIKEEGKNGVLAATKSSATSAEIVGYISHSLGIEFVYRTDNDEYVKTNMCTAHKTYGGEFTYKFTPMIGAKAYSSVDELLEGNFISKDDYVSVVD